MPEQHNDSQNDREAEENYSKGSVFPEDQSQQKWNAGMSGKEKVFSGKNSLENLFFKKSRTYYRMSREWADVGEAYKERPNQGKEGDAFHDKRHVINMPQADNESKKDQNHDPPDKNSAHVIHSSIGQNNVCDIGAARTGDIATGKKLHH